MMIIVFAAAFGAFLAWIGWLWRRTPAPAWTSFVALVPIGLGAWCLVAMAGALLSAHRVPVTLPAADQMMQVAMHERRMMRWGMRFWASALASAGWLLFVTFRWAAPMENTDQSG